MTIVVELQPDIERELVAQARQKGLSLEDYVRQIVLRQAAATTDTPPVTGQALIDVCAKASGLLSDREVDSLFSRSSSSSRQIDLS